MRYILFHFTENTWKKIFSCFHALIFFPVQNNDFFCVVLFRANCLFISFDAKRAFFCSVDPYRPFLSTFFLFSQHLPHTYTLCLYNYLTCKREKRRFKWDRKGNIRILELFYRIQTNPICFSFARLLHTLFFFGYFHIDFGISV